MAVSPTDGFFVPQVRPDARIRLFCVPYAGSWPWAFRDWPAHLDGVEVCVCYLPGRRKVPTEAPVAACMQTFVAELRNTMLPLLDRPYAIFGHSLGALLAFELAGVLERSGAPPPLRLFVSGCVAPARHVKRPPIHELADDQLIDMIQQWNGTPAAALTNPGLLKLTIKLLRSDLKLVHAQPMQTISVGCPITAFAGTSDPEASPEDIAEWRVYTRDHFDTHDLPGGHFFVHTQAQELLTKLAQYLP